ncbi:MAG: nucleotide exchange factor GrpE [Magnetococcus sp. YQC-5]
MLTPEQEGLMAQFRAYLEESATSTMGASRGDAEHVERKTVDLYTLFGELAALKNEVRIESRQLKTALEQFRGLVEPLQTGNAALRSEIDRMHEDRRDVAQEALRPVLLELLDIRDRMAAGLEMATDKRATKHLFKRMCHKEWEVMEAWREGQEMTLRRLDQTLAARQVHPINVVGQPLDPRWSRALRVEWHKGMAEGVVVAELRKGFFWGEALLRPAEVVVNKREG